MKYKVIKIKTIKKFHPLVNPTVTNYDLRTWASILTLKDFLNI